MSWTETGPRSWRTVYKIGNVDNNIDNYTLSADNQNLTMTTDVLVPTKSRQTMTFAGVGWSRADGNLADEEPAE